MNEYHAGEETHCWELETPPLRDFGSTTGVCRLEARAQDETEREVIGSTHCRVQGWGFEELHVVHDLLTPVEAID